MMHVGRTGLCGNDITVVRGVWPLFSAMMRCLVQELLSAFIPVLGWTLTLNPMQWHRLEGLRLQVSQSICSALVLSHS